MFQNTQIWFFRAILYFGFYFFYAINVQAQEVWSNISETTSENGYYKKILNLDFQMNHIHYQPSLQENPARVMVMISQSGKNDWYFKTISEKLNPEISILDFKLDYKLGESGMAVPSSFQKNRIKQYIKYGNLFNAWPPVYLEVAEIKRELEQKKYTQKYLLITGMQSHVLMYSRLIEDFNRIIIVSPEDDLDTLETNTWKDKEILWIGAAYEKNKLTNLQTKFGGKVYTYERSSDGQSLLVRNQKVLGDILAWLNN